MRIPALLLVTLLAAAATAAPLDLKNLGARLGVSPDDADRTELEAGIIAYNRGPAPRAYAVTRKPDGHLAAALVTGARFPAEAAVEALSRCERVRAMLDTARTPPCELVHADEQWIETAADLQNGVDGTTPAPVWRIDGGRGTVWLAGSVHVLKGPFYPLPAAFETAFDSSRQIALEIDPLRMGEADRQRTLQHAIAASPDAVKHALGQKRLAALAPLMLRHGIDPASILTLKPAILATQISIAEMAALGYLPDQGIDLHFARRAREQGKVILEIESVAEQMQALAGSPLDVQVLMLDATLQQLPDTQAQIGELLRAWQRADADALYALMMRDFSGSRALDRLGRRILDDRNRSMHTKIRAWLDTPGQNQIFLQSPFP